MKTAPTSIRLPPALAKRLAAEARRLDRSSGWIIRQALTEYLDKGTK